MKKVLVFIGIIIIGIAVCLHFPRQEADLAATSDFEAAKMIIEEAETGSYTVNFKKSDDSALSEEGIFRTLESLYPYAFSVRYTTFQNSRLRISLEIESSETQEQGIKKAKEIADKLIKPGMTTRQKLEAIHNYIILNCAYDQTVEENPSGSGIAFTAAGALVKGKAVCAGYSRAFAAICRDAGINAIYIADEGMNHGWNAVKLYGKTYYIDCTYDDPIPDRENSASMKYFFRTEEQLMLTHQWDREFYDGLLQRVYPQNYEYIQRLSDLGLSDEKISPSQTDKKAEAIAIKKLNDELGTSFSGSMTYGELYKKGWQALSEKKDGFRLIDRLIHDGKTTLTLAREVGL